MSDQEVKDNSGNYIGTIKDQGDELQLYDRNGKFWGAYSKSADATHDSTPGTIWIGSGNLLATLIEEMKKGL